MNALPDATKHEGFELLGKGNYVCVYEQPYNNLPITSTFDIQTDFENTCQQLGITSTKKESTADKHKKQQHQNFLTKMQLKVNVITPQYSCK